MAEGDPTFEAPVTAVGEEAQPKQRRWRRLGMMLLAPLLMIGGAAYYYFSHEGIVSTDNAYVQQDKVSVSAQVTGEIVEVDVHENQMVKAGDVLFKIDPEPFKIAIAQANAAIAAAQVDVTGKQTELTNTAADIAGAREDVAYFEEAYRRQAALMRKGFTTRAQLDDAEHAVSDARSKLADALAAQKKAQSDLATGSAAPGVNPGVLAATVQKRKAELDLSRTVVRAPVSGKVTQSDRLQLGSMMSTGLPALTIVASDRSWVEANFKETDLAHMRLGQRADLSFDAYPDVKLKGHVASLGAGTGSEFSVLPAQNANGNWVKVTQRVPVRIAIDDKSPRPLIAGLSTHVVIDTRR